MYKANDDNILIICIVLVCLFVLAGIIFDAVKRIENYKYEMFLLKRDWKECRNERRKQHLEKKMKKLWLVYLPVIGRFFRP